MTSLLRLVNRLLPFATPGTPLIQDLVHLAAICSFLYFAPQIQQLLQQRNRDRLSGATPPETTNTDDQAFEEQADHGIDENPHGFEHAADLQEDEPDDEAFRGFQRVQANEADPAEAPDPPAPRNVGAKKAKSLARKDERRRYHEFQRAQGDAQRNRDAEGAAEREAAQSAERERRKAVEAKIEAQKIKARELKRQQDWQEREEENSRKGLAINIVRMELAERRMSNLFEVARRAGGDVDDVWVEKLLKASGLLGKDSDGVLTMVTSTGWVVKVTKEDMMTVYEQAAHRGSSNEHGKVSYDHIATLLEGVLQSGLAA